MKHVTKIYHRHLWKINDIRNNSIMFTHFFLRESTSIVLKLSSASFYAISATSAIFFICQQKSFQLFCSTRIILKPSIYSCIRSVSVFKIEKCSATVVFRWLSTYWWYTNCNSALSLILQSKEWHPIKWNLLKTRS